jgi:outer membrane protein assembly factor BamB
VSLLTAAATVWLVVPARCAPHPPSSVRARPSVWLALIIFAANVSAEDWPMFGRDKTRNSVSPEKNPPIEWDVKTGKNIKWKAKIGSYTFATPVVANGLVWIGTNNDNPREPNHSNLVEPGGVLMCLRASDGKFLYQHASPQRKGPTFRWAYNGITSSPLVEGDRFWCTTTLAETICMDISPLRQEEGNPTEIWKLDMIKDLGGFPHAGVMGGGEMCSIGASYGDLIYVITSHGKTNYFDSEQNVSDPKAPALVCLNKNTGKVIWEDHSPGTNILLGEWASPLVMDIAGRGQVIAP